MATDDAGPRLLPMGLAGLLVQVSDRLDDAANRRALALAARLRAADLPGIREIAPSLGSVFLRLDPLVADRPALLGRLRRILAEPAAEAAAPARHWTIPVAFGGALGPDLDSVAAAMGCSADAAVAELTGRWLRVMALGFAPGLPYLGILPDRWDLPRKAGLTPRVPQGGVVVAVRQAIIFPADTPTGWWHVGQSGFHGFRPGAAEPFPFRPGDRVRLAAVTSKDLSALCRDDPEGGGARLDPQGGEA